LRDASTSASHLDVRKPIGINLYLILMLYPLSRKAIFEASPFADQFIFEMQRSYAAELDLNDRLDRSVYRKYYDHLQPLQMGHPPIDGYCIMAYIADTRNDFFERMLPALQQFFEELKIQQLYITDFLKTSLQTFPFKNFQKRNRLRHLMGWRLDYGGFQLSLKDLKQVLPLFYFSGIYARSAITIIADGVVPLSLRLCKDGNFHADYQSLHQRPIQEAASRAGFEVGDVNLCWDYKVNALPIR
jgi:hypothetical protein